MNKNTITTALAIITAAVLTTGVTATAAAVTPIETEYQAATAYDSHRHNNGNSDVQSLRLKLAKEAENGAVIVTSRSAEANGNTSEDSTDVDEFVCKNKLARTLHGAGFEGTALRVAWAIVMRESHGKNLDESSPWYSGGLGIWQVQTSAHSGKSWWSRSAMLDPAKQSRIAFKHLSDNSTNFVPWGIGEVKKSTKSGKPVKPSYDFSDYGGWSDWQRQSWIVAPFEQNWDDYPCT